MTHIPQWIEEQPHVLVGGIYFLIETENRGTKSYLLSETAPRTNQSHADRLSGWCGTSNDVATFARGLVSVERFARNGRTRISAIKSGGVEEREALEDLGYPALTADE
jgi:hypothetical protein